MEKDECIASFTASRFTQLCIVVVCSVNTGQPNEPAPFTTLPAPSSIRTPPRDHAERTAPKRRTDVAFRVCCSQPISSERSTVLCRKIER